MMSRELIGQEVKIEGNIKKISNTYVVIDSIKYECGTCGAILSVIQIEDKVKEPRRCSCGNCSIFGVISKEMHDQQDFILSVSKTKEEIKVYLSTKELIEKISAKRSSFIKVIGILKEEFKKKSTKGNLVIYAKEVSFNLK